MEGRIEAAVAKATEPLAEAIAQKDAKIKQQNDEIE